MRKMHWSHIRWCEGQVIDGLNRLLLAFLLLLPLAAALPFFGAMVAQQGFQGGSSADHKTD